MTVAELAWLLSFLPSDMNVRIPEGAQAVDIARVYQIDDFVFIEA